MAKRGEKKAVKRMDSDKWMKKMQEGSTISCVQLPEGCEKFDPKPGSHKVDFLPWVSTERNKTSDGEGYEVCQMTYARHVIASPDGKKYIACRNTQALGKKRCAVCDWLVKHGKSLDEDTAYEMKAKNRQLWLVNDKPGKKDNPLKVYDTTDKQPSRKQGFVDILMDAMDTSPDEYGHFWGLGKDGKTLLLKVAEQTGGDFKYDAVTRVDFLPRKYEYPEEMIHENPCLDDCVIDPGYEKVMELLDVGSEIPEEEGEEETPERNGRKARDKEEEPEEGDLNQESGDEDEDNPTPPKKGGKAPKFKVGDEVTYNGMECVVRKVSPDGLSYTLEDDEDETYKSISPDEMEAMDSSDLDDEDEPPAKGGKKKAPPEDEDEDDLDDEDLEEEETPKKKPARKR
jgi:hypothetical protein